MRGTRFCIGLSSIGSACRTFTIPQQRHSAIRQWRQSSQSAAPSATPKHDSTSSASSKSTSIQDEPQEAIIPGAMTRRLQNLADAAALESSSGSLLPVARPQHPACPGTGSEAVGDAALRMLVGGQMPLAGKAGGGRVVGPRLPVVVAAAVGGPVARKGRSSGLRIADARDRSLEYASMTEGEREDYRKEMRARFQPSANNLPATLAGLGSIANKRIEDAIARGQFKNLPRGRKMERDHNADSPFIDTTEYFMNKMIKKQDIVPPWIEKQQEIANAARRFRTRLRSDWKRHAARVIASSGGSLEQQVRRAEQYAMVEKAMLPATTTSPLPNDSDSMTQITASGQLKLHSTRISSQASRKRGDVGAREHDPKLPILPLRDLDWESTERSFHRLSIDSLNSLTRSYNLTAPRLVHKSYFNLERELKSCFADVAPLVGEEIRQRALSPKTNYSGRRTIGSSTIFQSFDRSTARVQVYDEDLTRKGYGLREFWNDLWRK